MEKGKRYGEWIFCPVNATDCPYFNDNHCLMYPDEGDPMEECDDFYYFWDSWSDWDNA